MTNKQAKPGRIKSAVLNWLGFGLTDTEHWRQLLGREVTSGERVNADTAMTLSAVYACVRLIAQTISTLPLNLYERTDVGRVEANGHPLARLLRMKPNADMTAVVFWEAVVASILLQRGAYVEKRMIGTRTVSIDFIHPIRISRASGGWRILDLDGSQREVPIDRVVYIPAFSIDGRCGKSVIEYGAEVLGSALAANKAANGTFKNGLQPTVAFKYPGTLRENQRADAREAIEKLSGASKAGKPIILEAGTDAMTIGINPKDAQLLESRGYSSDEVCSMFGVPPVMIGRGDKASSWASSSESLNTWFLQYSLRPWMRRIEMAVWDGLLTPAEQGRYYAEFAVEGLLRADTAGRTALYASALQNGWMNRNQVARLENMPPVPGGDIYTVQSNLVPIDKVGQQITPGTPAQPEPNP